MKRHDSWHACLSDMTHDSRHACLTCNLKWHDSRRQWCNLQVDRHPDRYTCYIRGACAIRWPCHSYTCVTWPAYRLFAWPTWVPRSLNAASALCAMWTMAVPIDLRRGLDITHMTRDMIRDIIRHNTNCRNSAYMMDCAMRRATPH